MREKTFFAVEKKVSPLSSKKGDIELRFFIVDDDFAVHSMVKEIIEDADLGETVDMAEDGEEISSELLNLKNVDILL